MFENIKGVFFLQEKKFYQFEHKLNLIEVRISIIYICSSLFKKKQHSSAFNGFSVIFLSDVLLLFQVCFILEKI